MTKQVHLDDLGINKEREGKRREVPRPLVFIVVALAVIGLAALAILSLLSDSSSSEAAQGTTCQVMFLENK